MPTEYAKVAYIYDPDIGSYYYGQGHPMKPQRIRMTHSLILAYNLYRHLEVFKPHEAESSELLAFHDSDYVSFLAEVTPSSFKPTNPSSRLFNLETTTDCPIFDGLYTFQSSCAGASLDAACLLNHKLCDIAINWSGGLHHAKRSGASGFCYFNDAVLGIMELLKYHTRVMYIDIDVHHGDGVEEAFFLSNRVLTVSFHKFGNFFPGTGDLTDVGAGIGKYYAINVPLKDGIDDASFQRLFRVIIPRAVEVFRPEAIVLQCGADSLTGDRLGTFNLTTFGHSSCVDFVKSFKIPLMLLGGGGYIVRNVARAWLYETAVALGAEEHITNKIPTNEYSDYFGPSHNLHLIPDPDNANTNSPESLNNLIEKTYEHLRHLEHVPSAPFSLVPQDFFASQRENEDEDEYAQCTVEWDGGGLGEEAVVNWKHVPSRLRRRGADALNEGTNEDRDLRNPDHAQNNLYKVGSCFPPPNDNTFVGDSCCG